MEAKELSIPRLRQDIQIQPAPFEPEGTPTWTLYDPAANKYYKIGWLEFECLARFQYCRTATDLVRLVEKETALEVDEDTVKALVSFLIVSNLIQADSQAAVDYFGKEKERKRKAWWERVLHGYLYFTLPLFKSQHFLEATFPYIRFLFTRQFMTGVLLLLGFGIFLSLRRFDEFFATFMSYMNVEGALLFLLAMIFVKVFHEFGHAYTATKYGVPVPTMGIAMIVMYPVLYSETTNAWKLKNRRERMYIAAGGVMAEMAVASVALLLWHLLTPGLAQSLCFMMGVASLLASLLVNFNPLMRFDGYYLFSDFVGIDNLQDRSFSFAKWKLRRFLWGWDDPPPETLPPERRNFLAAFGYATWVYRFSLYIGIALLVYHMFFKPMGLILMVVEVAFFIALPVLRELGVWWKEKKKISASRRGQVVAACVVILVILSFVPTQESVEIPAVLHAESYTRIYAPGSARIDEIAVVPDQEVAEGQLLFSLSSPEIEYHLEMASQKLKALLEMKDSGQANRELLKKRMTLDSEIDTSRKEVEGLQSQKNRLQVKAPYAGHVRDMDRSLRAGQWVNPDQMLILLIDTKKSVLTGYVLEQDIGRISKGAEGDFYAEFTPFARFPVTLTQIGQNDTQDIYWQELASVYGGPLPSERNSRGNISPLARYTFYAVKFDIRQYGNNIILPGFVARGFIRLKAAPSSLSKLLIKRAISVLVEESGL